MHWIGIGFLIGVGIMLAVVLFRYGGNIAALLGVAVVVGGVGLFGANLIYSAYLQAPGLLIALPLIGGVIYVLARRGRAARNIERE